MRFGGVDPDVAGPITAAGRCHPHRLVPAVHPRDRVRLNREGEVLVHTGVTPPKTLRIRVAAYIWFDRPQSSHRPGGPVTAQVDGGRHGARPVRLADGALASHVMAAGDHTGADAFGDPGFGDEMPDRGLNPHQVAGLRNTEPRRVGGMNPHRIRVGQFIEPLGVGGSGVHLRGDPKRRKQHHLITGERIGMNVAFDVAGQRVLGPAPCRQRTGTPGFRG